MQRTEGQDGSNAGQQHASTSTGLWSTILASTQRRSRSSENTLDDDGRQQQATGTSNDRRILVLGSHGVGKRTLIDGLRSTTSSGSNARRDKGKGTARTYSHATNGADRALTSAHPAALSDLGLSYQYIDLENPDADDDSSRRISVYTASEMHAPPYSTLLPLALPPESLRNSLVLLVVDWEDPWAFLDNLRDWLKMLQNYAEQLVGVHSNASRTSTGSNPASHLELACERLEAVVRSYVELSGREGVAPSSTTITSSKVAADPVPLPSGSLTSNLGANIIVVCTKSDRISSLERSAYLTEEQIDYVQQCLRTICLAYGAALFSISSLHPATTSRLKAYIYHRLCARVSSMTTAGETDVHQGLLSKAFPHRANALDREQLVIPSGWDTHGKIKILRNGFSPEDLIEAWSSIDVLSDKHHRSGPTPAGSSACQMYKQVIGDSEPGIKPRLGHTRIDAQDEQDFLRIHYDVLSREAAKRQAAQTSARQQGSGGPTGPTSMQDQAARFFSGLSGGSAVVGPMGSTSLSMPTVEKAMDRGDATASTSHHLSQAGFAAASPSAAGTAVPMIRRDSSRTSGHTPASILTNLPTSPALGGASGLTNSTGNAQPNEVLASFFQSLLSAKKDGPATPTTASVRTPSPASLAASQTVPRSGSPAQR